MSTFDFMNDLPPADLSGVSADEVVASIRTMDPERKVQVLAAVDAEIEQRRAVGNIADGVLIALRIARTLLVA